ncbi:DUF5686 and carboxypeptidase-like regulatory domain-containing protein [Tannerella forsythia]|uniref:DUF5686 and carboxypeptidase-like regulatory domain-containing protein n=1 Tax=Tannerella forsythia TaxID=28112 RepID=UPI00155F0B57
MKKTIRYIFFLVFTFSGVGINGMKAQQITSVSGVVRDSITGETLPYVSMLFEGSSIGGISDLDGNFNLQNNQGLTTLTISYVGYTTKVLRLKAGQKNEGVEVLLAPSTIQISEIVVKPKREKYSRKNNPAVELMKKVVARKDSNRITQLDEYQTECYEKMTLSLDKFDADFEKNKLMKKFKFLKNYLDSSEIDGKPILTLSLREKISDMYYRKNPKTEKIIVKAQRQQGVDQTLDEYGTISANLEEILKGIDVFDNNIPFLLNRFVSPLSSVLANAYYQYYIMDTVDVRGEPCVDLAFVPVNPQSYGFTGRLYITLDGTYAVKKVRLNVPRHINLNYVKDLRIDQEFKRREDGLWELDKDNTYVVFYFIDGGQQIYAHQLRSYSDYHSPVLNGDSIFGLLGKVHTPLARHLARPDSFWVNNRHVPLKEKENAIEHLLDQLRAVPVFNVFLKTVEILISGYIPINNEHTKNKLDFGPMNTTFSSNVVEGFRIRAGAMTTANLHPHLFFGGYAAYGMNDRKWKYSGQVTYSFNEKEYHEKESPINNLSFLHEYDLYTPGQDFLFTSKDNVFVAWKVGKSNHHMNYLRKTRLQYEKEWLNGLSIRTWMQHQNNEATGSLRYILHKDDDIYLRLKDITTVEWGAQLRFAPGERAYNSRLGKSSALNLSKDAPVFKLSHQIGFNGLLGGEYRYNRTEASVSKRIWLSSFGHIDANLKGGKVWDEVPFPLLIMPNTNQAITIQPEAFHLMNPMEFLADQYVSFEASYHLKGWILNRIPLINLLQLREVASISGVWGSLSDRNNPDKRYGLFVFPEGSQAFGNKPYLEFSVGVENILRVLQINYYRRLSYLDHPDIQKHGIRIAMRFSF